MDYLKKTWVDERLYVDKSQISGQGLFARESIKTGESLIINGGELVARKNFNEVEEKYRIQSVFPISENYFLAAPASQKQSGLDEYLNHSCDSNCWMKDEVAIIARRDIAAGEEITLDSAMWNDDDSEEYTENGECMCGSGLCRHKITAEDWKISDLQKRYAGHFSPFLQKKIDKLNG